MSRSTAELKKHVLNQVLIHSESKTGVFSDQYFNPKNLGKKPQLTRIEKRVRKTFIRLAYSLN